VRDFENAWFRPIAEVPSAGDIVSYKGSSGSGVPELIFEAFKSVDLAARLQHLERVSY